MRTAIVFILLTSVALAGEPASSSTTDDASHRAQEKYTLGVAAAKAGHRTEAVQHFQEALTLDPAHRLAPFEYEKLIRAPGRKLSAAMREYDELLELAPGRAWLFNNYGYLLRSTAEAHGAAETAKADASKALYVILVRAVQVYEAACKLAPEDAQILSDTGLTLEFYPTVRDDESALTYFARALDLTDGLYRDAFNGLVRVCERTKNWEKLKECSTQLLERMEAGKSAVSPKDDGSMREVGVQGSAILRAHAEKALEAASFFLTGGTQRRLIPAPALTPTSAFLEMPVLFELEKPSETLSKKSAKLKYETKKPLEYRATKTVREVVMGRVVSETQTEITLRLERDKKQKGVFRITAGGDSCVAGGYFEARVDKFGVVDEETLAVLDAPTPHIEQGAAASLLRCLVPVPNTRMKIGETRKVDMLGHHIRDTGRPVPEGVVSAKGWQTLLGVEKIGGKRCARLRTVYNATVEARGLRFKPHHAPAEGLVHIKGTCTVTHGLDGIPRRITWDERQSLDFSKAKVITGPGGRSGFIAEFIVTYEIEVVRAK